MPEEEPYETFVGRGNQLRYRCPECPFDSYSIGLLETHIKDSHVEERKASAVTLFDADDKPIDPGSIKFK